MKPEKEQIAPDAILGYCVRDQGRQPITIKFWKFLHGFNLDSEQEEAQRIALYVSLLEKAKTTDEGILKASSDAIRNRLGEVPSVIPESGFENVDDMNYPDCLSYDELRARVMAHMQKWGLVELFAFAEAEAAKHDATD